jgi:3-hydroxybutyryl-CoA dehydratase
MVFNGRGYDEVAVGDEFSDALTITETHLVLAAGLIGDFHPLHVNQTFAEHSRYGGRILHGVFTAALMGGPLGQYFSGTGIAHLEHNCRFRHPVRAGDTLTTTWTVTGKTDKPHRNGGIVSLSAQCRNQLDVLVAEADAKLIVRNVTDRA